MSDVNLILKDYNKIIAEVLEIRKEATEKIKNSLNGLFSDFFNNTPEMVYITWDQYTPYFNDGDTCEFCVHDKWFVSETSLRRYNEDDESDIEDLDQPTGWGAEEAGFSVSSYYKELLTKEFTDAYGAERAEVIIKNIFDMGKILDSIPDEIYLDAFGDHARIIVNKDGIAIDGADHD